MRRGTYGVGVRRAAGHVRRKTCACPEDVVITLVENGREDWSFGNGAAQYLTMPREAWR